jgi:hypothetical protein
MLRPLSDFHGWYLDNRHPLVETVEGADAWLFCQGILSIGGAAALRCQSWICRGFVDDEPVGRQQCGRIATLAPDGEALCCFDYQESWFCGRCGVQFATKHGGMEDWYGFCCPRAPWSCAVRSAGSHARSRWPGDRRSSSRSCAWPVGSTRHGQETSRHAEARPSLLAERETAYAVAGAAPQRGPTLAPPSRTRAKRPGPCK